MAAESTLWNQCTRVLQAELPEQQFNTWIRPLQAVDDGGVLRLLAPNRFVIDWVQQNYLDRILEVVVDADVDTRVVVEVGSREGGDTTVAAGAKRRVTIPAERSRAPVVSRLNPLFTFAQSSGDDILFTTSDGTSKLDHEIERRHIGLVGEHVTART